MQRLGRMVLGLAVVVLAVSPALAQRQQRQGRGGFGGGTLFLLSQKSVQEDLKLSSEQVTKVKDLSEKQRGAFRGQRDLSREERRAKFQEQAKATQKAVAEILKPDQQKRIKQIVLQRRGGQALSDPEVAKTLNLSDEQQNKIKSIREAARGQRGERGQRGQRSEEARKKREEARKAVNEKLLNVLTGEQKSKWKEMTGAPFTGEISRPQFRRPRTPRS